jgi:hypothetical protein
MERGWRLAIEVGGTEYGFTLPELQRVSSMDCVLTEPVLAELKRQAPAGCVLCSLDALDGEEWD